MALAGITKEQIAAELNGLGKAENEKDFNAKLAEVLAQLAEKVIAKAKN